MGKSSSVSSPSSSVHRQHLDRPPEVDPGKNGAAAGESEELRTSSDGPPGMAVTFQASNPSTVVDQAPELASPTTRAVAATVAASSAPDGVGVGTTGA